MCVAYARKACLTLDLVQEIAKAAEELEGNHEKREHVTPNQVPFVNGRDWIEPANDVLSHQVQFGNLLVNINSSAVHVPSQVYEGC